MRVEYCNYDLIKYHIAEALVMAGLAKETSIDHLEEDIKEVEAVLYGRLNVELSEVLDRDNDEKVDRIAKHLERGNKLGKAKTGSGHDCFLKGVVVTAVISAPAYQWPQIQRYHFQDIITSQSKMHRITSFNIAEMCNPEVDEDIIKKLEDYVKSYNWTNIPDQKDYYFRKIINNAPQGLRLAAGITTNYLQLKTQYYQRKNHKLAEWNTDFINWLEELPYFFEYIGVER